MQKRKNKILVLWMLFKSAISSDLQYRWRLFIWLISDLFQPFLLAVLWLAAINSGSINADQNQVISYYFLLPLVARLTQDWSWLVVSNIVIWGEFSNFLVKPLNYLADIFVRNMAGKLLRLVYVIPFLVIAFVFLKQRISFNT